MKMIDVGRVCLKIAGRDAGKLCVVVDVLDSSFVLIDGQTRRKRCNRTHLEPTKQVINIKKGATHKDVVEQFKGLNIKIEERKTSVGQKAAKPAKQRRVKPKLEKVVKKGKPAQKKPKDTQPKANN
ncbi:50S ribosomal protein L14e [Candidatus Woesearchaeota archaeon]|nr:50S ribosomal protein L14e [Candidatus Woesearchaeota archaeon]